MTAADLNSTILAVWRIEQPRLITGLSRMLRDVPLAEDLTQEALVAALEHWPGTCVPEKPSNCDIIVCNGSDSPAGATARFAI